MEENEENEKPKTKEEILEQFPIVNNNYSYTLKDPISFGEEIIKVFVLQRPRAKHVRGIKSGSSMDSTLQMISKISAQPDRVIDELTFEDMHTLAEFFEAFG